MLDKVMDWFREKETNSGIWVSGMGADNTAPLDKRKVGIVAATLLLIVAIISYMVWPSGQTTNMSDGPNPDGQIVAVPSDEPTPSSSSSETTTTEPTTTTETTTSRTPTTTSPTTTTKTPKTTVTDTETQVPPSINSPTKTTTPPRTTQPNAGSGPGSGPTGKNNGSGPQVMYHVLVSSLTGTGKMDVSYLDENGKAKTIKADNTWSIEFKAKNARPLLGIAAQSKDWAVTCTIMVNGIVASVQTSKGGGYPVTCGNVRSRQQ